MQPRPGNRLGARGARELATDAAVKHFRCASLLRRLPAKQSQLLSWSHFKWSRYLQVVARNRILLRPAEIENRRSILLPSNDGRAKHILQVGTDLAFLQQSTRFALQQRWLLLLHADYITSYCGCKLTPCTHAPCTSASYFQGSWQ